MSSHLVETLSSWYSDLCFWGFSIDFLPITTDNNSIAPGAALDGHIDIHPPTTEVPLNEPTVHHRTGVAADFLTKRGFGWLMDEEIDEDDKKPIL